MWWLTQWAQAAAVMVKHTNLGFPDVVARLITGIPFQQRIIANQKHGYNTVSYRLFA